MTHARTAEFKGYIIKRASDGRTLRHATSQADCERIDEIACEIASREGSVYILENVTYQSKYTGE